MRRDFSGTLISDRAHANFHAKSRLALRTLSLRSNVTPDALLLSVSETRSSRKITFAVDGAQARLGAQARYRA